MSNRVFCVKDLEQMRAYGRPPVVEEFVSLVEKGEHVVLNIERREEAPDWGWIEGEGSLLRLMGLRDDILRMEMLAAQEARLWQKIVDLCDHPR